MTGFTHIPGSWLAGNLCDAWNWAKSQVHFLFSRSPMLKRGYKVSLQIAGMWRYFNIMCIFANYCNLYLLVWHILSLDVLISLIKLQSSFWQPVVLRVILALTFPVNSRCILAIVIHYQVHIFMANSLSLIICFTETLLRIFVDTVNEWWRVPLETDFFQKVIKVVE